MEIPGKRQDSRVSNIMVKVKLRADESLEANLLFPTIHITPSDYSIKFQRIQFPFRLRVETHLRPNRAQGTPLCECWLFKRRRKNNFILVQNGKTNKFVRKKAFRIPYFEFTSRKRVT